MTINREYRQKILKELEALCKDLLHLVAEKLLSTASTDVSKAYYYISWP